MARTPTPTDIARQVEQSSKEPPQQVEKGLTDWSATASTGSLLTDLAMTGLKSRYGGLPGGMVIEISGMPGTAKTTMMAEIVGSVQRLGGEARIKDPEARLDEKYCKQMGVKLPMVLDEKSGLMVPDPEVYTRPDTVTDVIESIIGPLVVKDNKTRRDHSKAWCPTGRINCEGVDSLASLSTRMEMDQGDKMGQRRAKELSEGMRIIARHLGKYNILMVCTNQLRDNIVEGPMAKFAPKKITPGGNAIPYYSSIRLQLTLVQTLKKDKDSDPYGKLIRVYVSKNSKDIEYRSALIRLIFGYGIDDIGANLMFLKKHGELSELNGQKYQGYVVGDAAFPLNTKGGALEAAIKYVEDNDLEEAIREEVVDLWNRLEAEARPQRKEKVRG